MSNDLTIKDNTNLSKAREDFIRFKNKQVANTQKRNTTPSEQTAPTTAHEILLCSKKPGVQSLMTYEVSTKEAVLIKATPLSNTTGFSSKESQNRLTVKRKIMISGDYDGCPYCGQVSVVHCNCGTISCGPDRNSRHTCPGCGDRHRTVPRRQKTTLFGSRPNHEAREKSSPLGNTNKSLSQDSRFLLNHKK